ncbi:ankyrin repeat-containing domain protein [Triangularia verruculosa]|uniref:Ankyrin repeat-containing domain protein n=1 Tax=Triangularia verruculosa TaxID=2587418 RepID=A0AAN6XGL6_9PEZI|nr:ankyrin repeat-containing domain protein [Triangularia verruculosa]
MAPIYHSTSGESWRLLSIHPKTLKFCFGRWREGRSQNVFQWVILVIPRIIWLFQESNSLSQMLVIIDKIPQEVHDLYNDIILDIMRKQPAQSLKLFQWVCFGFKPFSVSEIRCAMNVDAIASMAGKSFEDWGKENYHISSDGQMRKLLRSLSGGLVEIVSSGVQLIHQSVRDFLFDAGFRILDPGTATDENAITGEGHSRIGRCCLVYYLAVRKKYLTRFHTFTRREIQSLTNHHSLLRYCLEHWLRHISTAEERGIYQSDLIDFFPASSSHRLTHWELMVASLDINTNQPTSILSQGLGTTLLHEAVRHRIRSLIPPLLSIVSIKARDAYGRTPLSIAAGQDTSDPETIQLLFRHPNIDLNSKDINGRTALSYTVESNDAATFRMLLTRPTFDWTANFQHEYKMGLRVGSTLYHTVSLQGTNILLEMLAHPKLGSIDGRSLVNAALDSWGYCPPSRCHCKIPELLRILLEHRNTSTHVSLNREMGDVQAEHPDWKTIPLAPLLYFTRHNHYLHVLRYLLEYPDVHINARDRHGWCVLHHAICDAFNLHKVSDQDIDRLCERLRLILRDDRLDVNSPNTKGDTPFLFALKILTGQTEKNKTQLIAAIKVMLSHQYLDVNRRTNFGSGMHPICFAVDHRLSLIVSPLLSDRRLALRSDERNLVMDYMRASDAGFESEGRMVSSSGIPDTETDDDELSLEQIFSGMSELSDRDRLHLQTDRTRRVSDLSDSPVWSNPEEAGEDPPTQSLRTSFWSSIFKKRKGQ